MSRFLNQILDLRYSRVLVKILDFGGFPNLEWLDLEGCVKLVELDPSLGLLRKLVYLNVKDCGNLIRIPNNIFGLSSLKDLNMCGCSKLFDDSRHLKKPDISSKKKHDISESASHSRSMPFVFEWTMLLHNSLFPAPTALTYLLHSLRSLYCLREVDISYCHLSQLPDTIECLRWLERLNLGGIDFATLPSLRKLSKLVYLNLEHCRLLEFLPQLPFSNTIEWAHNENKFFSTTGLVIFNCPELSDKEHCSSMTFSWMMQFIQANPPSHFDRIQIVTPGIEIPSWINNRSVDGSIPIDLTPIMHDNNNNIIGFVCCAVFSMAPRGEGFSSPARMELVFDPIDSHKISCMRVQVILNGFLVLTKSSHLWIIYLPRESYDEFGKIHFDIIRGEGLDMKVKTCGYRWVCKQDLQEFNLTMNHEKSLARTCKTLAI
ncbi:disease resistance protein (TIR-NBS-LRR class) [Medicago truncatula]|uniref:Disease resistance protein (TIR-NBS-LRR class) n=1 Tax=Medicago truncatula TaxID=3880 RepID=G7KPJ6_MEDTR|nr:disease resistance protein (TIR-NBS-LRR class) [Medicago truncatula]